MMSFTTLKKEELLRVVARFEVRGVTEENTKPEIIAALEEADVSWSNYRKFVAPVPEDKVTEESTAVEKNQWYDNGGELLPPSPQATDKFEEMVLLKMTRANGTFEIRGHRFTKKQPFKLLPAYEAQEIIDAAERVGGGFRVASPAEAQSFFG